MKHPITYIIPLTACLLALLCGGCQGNAASTPEPLPTIVVGSDTYPPFNYIGADGQPTGIDVALAGEAFRRMGYEAEFRTIDWSSKKDLLESGTIDCAWGCFSMDGREDEYQWAGPYMISRQVVAVMPDSDIVFLSDLAGRDMAVQATTKPEELFLRGGNSRLPQLGELFSLKDRELMYPFLSKGYVDAIAAHETAILQYMKDYDVEYRILDEPLLTVGLGVAFSLEDDRGLAQALSDTLDQMREDGTSARIVGRWLEDPERYLEVDGYDG
ncbi:ABC transporter substrate-binding protein [Pseudoflavonifractor sp. MSJ-37]|uniref:substrate-binding periplasmic protein n=1 Tax=Pseudoflavonifractor sp. MSJ-37 TaxID=2841531 RepID=UPI001C115009|nr:transporter substrate-binding domain-containing protein [Pseudoflavonifractor sp. MSJ-37]MBU5435650.1 transporter substrate-binding domain-containing protein [Pseudoflavonifractor sp. MSJ-37]